MHGVARVMTKGYAEQRNRELHRLRPRSRRADPHAERNLLNDLRAWGGAAASAVVRGPSPDGPRRLN